VVRQAEPEGSPRGEETPAPRGLEEHRDQQRVHGVHLGLRRGGPEHGRGREDPAAAIPERVDPAIARAEIATTPHDRRGGDRRQKRGAERGLADGDRVEHQARKECVERIPRRMGHPESQEAAISSPESPKVTVRAAVAA
jgi:hypothetical protein